MLNPNVNNFYELKASVTLAGSGATEILDLFKINGAVKIKELSGIVTSAATLTNMTDCHFNVNDAAADYPITKTTTCTMSTAIVGSIVTKLDTAAAVAYFKDGTTGGVIEAGQAQFPYEFVVIKKSGAETVIQFIYTTTDSPIAATMDFYVKYEKIADGYLEVA
jgi:hypothetical protein